MSDRTVPICNAALRFLLLTGSIASAGAQTAKVPLMPAEPDYKPELATAGVAQTGFTANLPGNDNNDPHLARLAKASVQLFDRHRLEEGSGVIIADSADATGYNAILTVKHVAKHSTDQKHAILISASDNSPIGIGVAVDIPRKHPYAQGRDIAIIRIIAFFDAAAEKKFREIQGVELAPEQARSGYIQGIVNTPIPQSPGSSGGGIIDRHSGKLVGLMQSGYMRSDMQTTELTPIGPASFEGTKMSGPVSGRLVATSVIDHSILQHLHNAGLGVHKADIGTIEVFAAGFPQGFAALSEGAIADRAKIGTPEFENFDTPAGQLAATGSFTDWKNPQATLSELRRLMMEAHQEKLPSDREIEQRLLELDRVTELKKIPYLATSATTALPPLAIDNLTALMRQVAGETHDPALATDLQAASEQLPHAHRQATQAPLIVRIVTKAIP